MNIINLVDIAYILVGIVAAILILALIVAFVIRKRLGNKPQLPEQTRYDLQAALLDAIEDKSANQGTVVNISPFWRKSGVKSYQKNSVIQPLIDNGDVTVHEEPQGEPWDTLRSYWNFALFRPPTQLILTDRTWTRMVHGGVSGRGVVIERVGTLNWQNAGRDINQSPQTVAGRDADVRVGPMQRSETQTGLSLDQLASLISALREDAPNLGTSGERAKVRELATKLENEVDQDDPDPDSIEDSVSRAERYVSRAGGMIKATAALIESWHKLRGQT